MLGNPPERKEERWKPCDHPNLDDCSSAIWGGCVSESRNMIEEGHNFNSNSFSDELNAVIAGTANPSAPSENPMQDSSLHGGMLGQVVWPCK